MEKNLSYWLDKYSEAILLLATLVVNICNYGLNVILARWLGPEGFSEANILAVIVMIFSFLGLGVQMIAAKLEAEDEHSWLTLLKNRVWIFAIVTMMILLLGSQGIKNYLQFDSSYSLMIVFAGLPFYMGLCVQRGVIQGKQQFGRLAMTYVVEMIVRVGATIGLIFLVADHYSEIIGLGFLLSFLVVVLLFRVDIPDTESKQLGKIQLLSFVWMTILYELSQVLINNGDIILVKHYFEANEAGLYASLATLGKAIFFLTWSVVMVLFPKVITLEKEGKPHAVYFWRAMMIVAGLCGSAIVTMYLFGDWIIQVAFGAEYLSVSSYLYLYTIATSIFACANVFVYYYLSLEKYIPVIIALVFGIMQITAIILFHESMAQVIWIQIGVLSAMLMGMIIYKMTTGGSSISSDDHIEEALPNFELQHLSS